MMEERMARVGERERVKLNGSNILPFCYIFVKLLPLLIVIHIIVFKCARRVV